jgi:hypothetical protein
MARLLSRTFRSLKSPNPKPIKASSSPPQPRISLPKLSSRSWCVYGVPHSLHQCPHQNLRWGHHRFPSSVRLIFLWHNLFFMKGYFYGTVYCWVALIYCTLEIRIILLLGRYLFEWKKKIMHVYLSCENQVRMWYWILIIFLKIVIWINLNLV